MAADNRLTVALLYLAGVAQGLALVTFPAASATFISPTGFHLGSAQYGAMFIPQVAMAILASAFGPGPHAVRQAQSHRRACGRKGSPPPHPAWDEPGKAG